MAHPLASHPDVEVHGQAIRAFMDVAGRYAPLTRKIMAKHGIEGPLSGDTWYPLSRWLEVQREIATSLGERTLFAFGKRIPSHVPWPSGITTIEAALGSIDVAFHMNNRLHGKVMYDPATSTMLEGIGHYHCHLKGGRDAVMVCDNPYDSEFDRGIITGVARMFKPGAEVTLDPTAPTRKQGGSSCTYLVTW
jgi:hypothetical protein